MHLKTERFGVPSLPGWCSRSRCECPTEVSAVIKWLLTSAMPLLRIDRRSSSTDPFHACLFTGCSVLTEWCNNQADTQDNHVKPAEESSPDPTGD